MNAPAPPDASTNETRTWQPTPEQTANAQARVGATWARLLAEKHPGHRFVIEWRERTDTVSGATEPKP